jgi:hypothetical protein
MKTVKLTKYECQVILDTLSEHYICRATCYCDYKTNMCNKLTEGGHYRCKLQETIRNIEEKLEASK